MTNEELDEARAKEAWRQGGIANPLSPERNAPLIAARLARENWTPPEPVDPDLIAVLEFLSKRHPGSNYYHGETAKTDALTQTCLAAYKAGREQEQERAKVLVEYVKSRVLSSDAAGVAIAKYRGEA